MSGERGFGNKGGLGALGNYYTPNNKAAWDMAGQPQAASGPCNLGRRPSDRWLMTKLSSGSHVNPLSSNQAGHKQCKYPRLHEPRILAESPRAPRGIRLSMCSSSSALQLFFDCMQLPACVELPTVESGKSPQLRSPQGTTKGGDDDAGGEGRAGLG